METGTPSVQSVVARVALEKKNGPLEDKQDYWKTFSLVCGLISI